MEKTPAFWIRITAAAVVAGGVVAAAGITHNPVPEFRIAGVSPQAVAELDVAAVIRPADKLEFPGDTPAPAPAPKPQVVVARKEKVPAVPPAHTSAPAPALPSATATPTPDDPGPKDIALVGITTSGGQDTAWLMNVDGRDREQAAVGENAFGYTVQTISDDSVVLSRNGKKYGLRVGEKPVMLASAAAEGGTLSGTEDAGGTPGGFGGPGGPGGQGGPGGRGQFGNRAGFGNNGGGFNRTFNGFGGGAPTSFGSSAQASTPSNAGGFGNRGGFGNNGGGFGNNGGGFGGGGFGGFGGINASTGGAPASQFSSSAKGATSNAQTARRRGVAVTGGETAMPTPTAIVNPQTQRRLGISGTGSTPAFGTSRGTVSSFTSPNGTTQRGFSAAQGTGTTR